MVDITGMSREELLEARRCSSVSPVNDPGVSEGEARRMRKDLSSVRAKTSDASIRTKPRDGGLFFCPESPWRHLSDAPNHREGRRQRPQYRPHERQSCTEARSEARKSSPGERLV